MSRLKVTETRPIAIRFTDLELQAIRLAAERAGLPLSTYVREMIVARSMQLLGESEDEISLHVQIQTERLDRRDAGRLGRTNGM